MNTPGKVVVGSVMGLVMGAGITHFGIYAPRFDRMDDALRSLVDPRRIHASDKDGWDAMWPGLVNEVVALIERHHDRFGAYPEQLADLEYPPVAPLPHLALLGYRRSDDGGGYHIEPPEGLDLPIDFWEGTGRLGS